MGKPTATLKTPAVDDVKCDFQVQSEYDTVNDNFNGNQQTSL